ncbi:TerC/Alx family metal homeostasis membrane protein [Salinisphaera orenii]|uniref:TerC/Alx family metal homeostasis membrane protein n=1 Tax=Salinisphaera orenii TaxID=856731 RepID=UPI000DBE0076
METSTELWLVTISGFAALIVADFWTHVRRAHTPGLLESGLWSLFYILLATAFGAIMWLIYGAEPGFQFFAGFVTEKSLSVDNLFVFVVILSAFRVPNDARQTVLLFGIVIALLLRGAFIALGHQAIEHLSWTFYAFGAFLIYTAIKLAWPSNDNDEHHDVMHNPIVRLVKRLVPMSDNFAGSALITRVGGRRLATPMVLVITAIGATDVLFALDSIPAIYGLTRQPYIVFTANAFALIGLVQLYFLLGELLDRLIYLSYGLGAVLLFIGVKMIFEALRENQLPFINGGQPVFAVPDITTSVSLGIIILILISTTIASLLRARFS